MPNRSKFLFLFLFIFCLHHCSTAQDIHFSPVKPPEGASGAIILGITQDPQGFLWLATQNGLFKYDGYEYTAYNSREAVSVECVTAAKDGSIWIGRYGQGRGAERLDPATGIFTHYHHQANDLTSIGNDSVSVILEDHEGTIWIGTNYGLDRFDSKTNTFIHYKHIPGDSSSLSSDGVRALYEDKEGAIWVGTGNAFHRDNPRNEGGLNKLDRQTGKFTRYLHKENDPHSLMDNRVRAIFEDSHGIFWVGTSGDGLHTMNRKNGTFERYLFDPAHPDKLSRPPVQNTSNDGIDHITFITEDNKGRIWIGTYAGGINVWDPATQKITYYGNDKKSKELLQDESFWTVYKARDGVIWISTFGSSNLYKINPYETRVPHTYIGDTIYAITEDNANLLWMATRGLVSRDSTGKMQHILLDKNLSSYKNIINNISKDSANELWLATNAGLYSFDPVTHNLKTYHRENNNANSLPSDAVVAVRSAPNGLWVGTDNGLGLLDTKTGMFKNYQHDPKDSNSISSNNITGIITESNGDLWVGTYYGLNRFNKQTGHFKKYLEGLSINCVIKDSEGNVWAATDQGITYRYNEQKDIFLEYTDQTGLLKQGTYVTDIVGDNQKNLWFITLKGIIELDVKTNETTLYGKNQGVHIGLFQSYGYARKNGEVLFGNTAGYFTFNDQLLKKNIPAPIVSITNFSLANAMSGSAEENFSNLISRQKDIRLSHDQNVFSFQFSSIDFISAHEDARLLYMLENYDKNWRPGNNDQTAYYFNVPPGQYVFKVKAANSCGIWAEKEITIIINPPWWSTWWAYCIYGLLLIGMVFIIYRFTRQRIIQKERERTRAKELAQAKEIEKAYHKLEQAHESLKSTQTQLIQSEKMASLGELTAGIAHEIQNPLNFVNNFSEVNRELIDELKGEKQKVEGERNNELENEILNDIDQNLEKISFHGKRADAIVKGMLQHSRTSSGQKELTDINALADEYLRLSYHGLRAKDKLFNARFETDFNNSVGKINIVPQDIGRVVLNLINNAFYAVNEKQKENIPGYEPAVTVSTASIKPPLGGRSIQIKVADNGGGIPQKVVDKIFQPFFTTKPTGQGTGLGLSLAYDIIKAHGGEIKVETKEGEGSEFVVELPI